MAVGRRAAVGTKTVQPVAAPLDGDKAASAAAAHAAALRLLTTRARTRRTCLGYPVAMRQVNPTQWATEYIRQRTAKEVTPNERSRA